MRYKELYNNELSDGPELYDNLEEAINSSIQCSLNNINDLITDGDRFVIPLNKDGLEEISKVAKDVILAIKGKFVSKYVIQED